MWSMSILARLKPVTVLRTSDIPQTSFLRGFNTRTTALFSSIHKRPTQRFTKSQQCRTLTTTQYTRNDQFLFSKRPRHCLSENLITRSIHLTKKVMDKPVCLMSWPYLESLVEEAGKHCQLVTWKEVEAKPDLKKKITAAFCYWALFPSEWRLDELENLKVVSNDGVGIDHIDSEYCKKRGIQVCNTPGKNSSCTADMGLTLLLGVSRRIIEGDQLSKKVPDLSAVNIVGRDLYDCNIGIVGLGIIGHKVAKRVFGFDMKINYYDVVRNEDAEKNLQATYYSNLEEMLPNCEFLVLCCPLIKQTRHLINDKTLGLLPKGAILVNISRGPVVDTDSLVRALQSGHIAAAGLDVTDPEPLPAGHPLLKMPNVIVTPHWGTQGQKTRRQMDIAAVENVFSAPGLPSPYNK